MEVRLVTWQAELLRTTGSSRSERALARRLRRHPTPAKRALWELLRRRQLGVRFRREAPVFGYLVDFYAPSILLVVEVNDAVLDARTARVEARDDFFRRWGYAVVRFTNTDVIRDTQRVLACLRAAISERECAFNSGTGKSTR